MTGIQWRPYQIECKKAIKENYDDGITRQLIVAATGVGKRMMAVNLISHFKRTLFIAHREELIMQAYDEIEKFYPMNVGIVKGTTFEVDKKIVVASVQTLCNRLNKIPPDTFNLVIVDESHHYAARTYLETIRHWNPKLLTGWTATPRRLDGLSLSNLFEKIVFEYGITDGIRDGYLAPIEAYQVKTPTDISRIKRTAGDFNQRQLSEAVDSELRNNLIVQKYKQYCDGRQFIAYTVDIDHAYHLRDEFRKNGIECDAVSSDTSRGDDRYESVKRFKAGELQGLINCEILTEGFDYSDVGCVDTETEILTNDGWKSINDPFDSVISFNTSTKSLEDVPVLARTDFNWNKGMINIKGGVYDLKVTTNHRMLIGTGRRTNDNYFFTEADTLTDYERFRIPISGKELSKELPISDDELRFIAWFLTDGGYPGRKRTVCISQAKPEGIKRIRELLLRLGYTFSEYLSNNRRGFEMSEHAIGTLTRFYVPKGVRRGRKGWDSIAKYLDKNYSKELIGMSSRQFTVFWEELLWGDGNGSKRDKQQLTGGNKFMLSGIQATAIMAGFSTNATWAHHEGHNDSWLIGIADKKYLEIKVNHKSRKAPAITLSNMNEECRVWCVQNRNETLIVRRNGSVAIIGNCVIMGRPTQSETLYTQCIGRGTRLKSELYKARFGTDKCTILDFVDNTGKLSLINAYELEKGLPIEDRMFLPKEHKEKLLKEEKERRERYIKLTAGKDKKVDLLKLPEVRVWDSEKMLEPATEKQIEWIKRAGIYAEDVEYTKKQASELISALPCAEWQIRYLAVNGYDVSKGASIGQFQRVKYNIDNKNKYAIK